jgi:tetratricopeptide (TPR) repeat protein
MSAKKKSKPPCPPLNASCKSPMGRKLLAFVIVLLVVIGAAWYLIAVRYPSHIEYRAAQQALERRDFATATRHLRNYLDAQPDDLETRFLAVQTARRQGDFGQAASLLQAYAQQPGSNLDLDLEQQLFRIQQGYLADADSILARCSEKSSSPQTSLILEAVIEGSLNSLVKTLQREKAGQAEVSMADFTRAQRAVDQWLKFNPSKLDQVQGHVWRGKLESVARDYPKAMAAFRKVIELDPDHFPARFFLAGLLAHQAPEEAAKHLELLHQRDPANAKVSFLLAKVRRDLGQRDQAEQLLDAILAGNSDNVPFLVERGQVALDQRLPRDAERWLRRAVALAPNHAQANLLLSQSLRQLDRESEGKMFHDRFLQIETQARRQRDELKKKGTGSK